MNSDRKRRPVLDRIIQAAFIIGFYDLIELIFEDIFLWLIIRQRKKRHRSSSQRTRNKRA